MTKHNESGFTLVEVLVAMMIFAVGILAILNMQIMSAATNVKSRGMSEGVIIAQNKIEELAILDYEHADLTDTDGNGAVGLDEFPPTDADADNADSSDLTNTRYNLFWNVEDDMPFDDTKTIRVIVRWSEKGIFQNFSIDMVKAKGA